MKNTLSLCEHCYRHIPGMIVERDGAMWIQKECPVHGYFEYMVDSNAEFYNELYYDVIGYPKPQGIMLNITERCNINCMFCYQQPTHAADISIPDILAQIDKLPKVAPEDEYGINLSGGDPSVRNDLPEVMEAMRGAGISKIAMLTNGVKFSKPAYSKQLKNAGLTTAFIGLNHKSYLTPEIHQKQLDGIVNCNREGIHVYYVSYTMASISHLKDILDEIQVLGSSSYQYRIRLGVKIGTYVEGKPWYMSDLITTAKQQVESNGWVWEDIPYDNNPYHVTVKINGILHRFITWATPQTIDLESLRHGPWCDFIPGKPVTNFLHQIMLRDAVLNKQLPLFDTVPERYQFRTGNQVHQEP